MLIALILTASAVAYTAVGGVATQLFFRAGWDNDLESGPTAAWGGVIWPVALPLFLFGLGVISVSKTTGRLLDQRIARKRLPAARVVSK